MTDGGATIRVNRAPVLTLWAAVVAERLGHPRDTALSLASVLAGTAARARPDQLRIGGPADQASDACAGAATCIRLLGRDVAVVADAGGPALADRGDGQAAPAAPVAAYLARAFGTGLAAARAAMEQLAAKHDPAALNHIGHRLYESFRPALPMEKSGRPAKPLLHLAAIRSATTDATESHASSKPP